MGSDKLSIGSMKSYGNLLNKFGNKQRENEFMEMMVLQSAGGNIRN
jgi:hypothetical protein